jgi:hypothetical protein
MAIQVKVTPGASSYEYDFDDSGYSTGSQACTNYAALTSVYAAEATGDLVTQFYTNSGLTTTFSGTSSTFYAWTRVGAGTTYRGQVNSSGVTSLISNC